MILMMRIHLLNLKEFIKEYLDNFEFLYLDLKFLEGL